MAVKTVGHMRFPIYV